MSKLISILIAGFVFWLIYFFLVPLLPGQLAVFAGVIVVLAAIVFLLLAITDYEWPWSKK